MTEIFPRWMTVTGTGSSMETGIRENPAFILKIVLTDTCIFCVSGKDLVLSIITFIYPPDQYGFTFKDNIFPKPLPV